jgi:hypothetical protein
MKTIIYTAIVMLIVFPLQAQNQEVKTYSVSINEFIDFVADKYENQENDQQNITKRHITFLVQVPNEELGIEQGLILKQGFKLLSKRLNDFNEISILSYFGFNGVVLDSAMPSELDKVYMVLNDMKGSVVEFHNDGIELAYEFAKKNQEEDVENSIVIIRNSFAMNKDMATMSKKEMKKLERKKKKKDILKVAVSILPEILAILKN